MRWLTVALGMAGAANVCWPATALCAAAAAGCAAAASIGRRPRLGDEAVVLRAAALAAVETKVVVLALQSDDAWPGVAVKTVLRETSIQLGHVQLQMAREKRYIPFLSK